MPREDDGRRYSDGFSALRSSSELDFVEDVNLTEGGTGGDEIGSARVMPDAIDFAVVLNLMLNHYLVRHAFVVFADGLGGSERLISQLSLEEVLIGQVNLCHDEAILLLSRGMRSVEHMAQPILIIAFCSAFIFIDPPFDAQRGPFQFLRVEGLVEVGGIPAPHKFLGDVVVERVLREWDDFLH